MRSVDEIAELRSKISRRTWWHRIDLGDGIVTPGLDNSPEKLECLGLPSDLSGKRVIDVGAWDGFFSFAAEKRGARVLATDYICWTGGGMHDKGGFDLAKVALGSQVEEMTVSVESLSVGQIGTFDIVLFLGVLYHSRNPLGYLETIRQITK